MVQNVIIEESNHIYLGICRNHFNWFDSMQLMHNYINCKLVTFLHFIFALVCVGISHQKRGD
jgi:hypothetical protein